MEDPLKDAVRHRNNTDVEGVSVDDDLAFYDGQEGARAALRRGALVLLLVAVTALALIVRLSARLTPSARKWPLSEGYHSLSGVAPCQDNTTRCDPLAIA